MERTYFSRLQQWHNLIIKRQRLQFYIETLVGELLNGMEKRCALQLNISFYLQICNDP